MCQLTFLDTELETVQYLIRNLLELNSITDSTGDNTDGVGYMDFDGYWTKEGIGICAVESAGEYRGNGAYHVRRASANSKKFGTDYAHPFEEEDLVLLHNGALHKGSSDTSNSAIFNDGKIIDSQMFLKVLKKAKGDNKLTLKHVNEAMEKFYGTFAFIIRDELQKDRIFFIRGKSKPLHFAELIVDDKVVGIVVNTHLKQLNLWLSICKSALLSAGVVLTHKVYLLKEESMFDYVYGSYKVARLGDVREYEGYRSTVYTPQTSSKPPQSPLPQSTGVKPSVVVPDAGTNVHVTSEILGYVERGLELEDICVIAYMLFGKDLYSLRSEEFETLSTFLRGFLETFPIHENKLKIKDGIFVTDSTIKTYIDHGIGFPFNTLSNKHLKSIARKQGIRY